MVSLFVNGAADMISVVVRQTLVQLDTPDEMRGRVSAVNSIFVGASIGVATWPADGRTANALFDTADRALYAATAESRHPRRPEETGRSAVA